MKHKSDNRGIIQLILLVIIFILIISYFGINLRSVVQSDTGKDNFGFVGEVLRKVWEFILFVWNSYLAVPFNYIWNDFIIKYIWTGIQQALQQAKP